MKFLSIIFFTLLSIAVQKSVHSRELNTKASLSYGFNAIDFENFQDQQLSSDPNVNSIDAELDINYKSRLASFGGVGTYFDIENSELADRSEFFEYQLNGNIGTLNRFLGLTYNTSQSYINADASNGLLNDKLLGSNNLTRTRQTNANLTALLPNQELLRLSGQVGYSKRSSDESDLTASTTTGLDTEGKEASISLLNGITGGKFEWGLNAAYSESTRANQGDFEFESYNGFLSIPILTDFDLYIDGLKNEQSISGNSTLSDALDYQQIGAGLKWNFGMRSYIRISSYFADSQRDDDEQFVGGEILLNLSRRSNLNARAEKDSLGERYSVLLNQSYRFWSINASYNEGISINSKIRNERENLGVFVCSNLSADINDCFIPTQGYELAPGESFRSLFQINSDLYDDVQEFKDYSLTVSFDNARKIRFSLNGGYRESSSLEDITNDRDEWFVSVDGGYKFNPYLTITLSSRYIESKRRFPSESLSKNFFASLGSTYRHSRNLKSSITLSHRRQESDIRNIVDTLDNRVIVSATYTF